MTHELRWNPLHEDWVILSTKRKKRFQRSSNPFSSDSPEMFGKSTPAILSNKYPNFTKSIKSDNPKSKNQSEPYGTAELLVESELEEGDFNNYSISEIKDIIKLLIQRTKELSLDKRIKYVSLFKNKGSEVGSSIAHPHMQIYGMPYVPPVIKREIIISKDFQKKNGKNLFDYMIEMEVFDKRRLLIEDESFVSFVPFSARWPFEVHIVSKLNLESIVDLNQKCVEDLSFQLKKVSQAYNSLFSHPMSYVMLLHQAPCRKTLGHYRFFVEYQPIFQSEGRLKHTAGIERLGSFERGHDTPENDAQKLREFF